MRVLAGFYGPLASTLAAAGFPTATRRKEAAVVRAAWGASGIAFVLSVIRLCAWLYSYIVVTDIRLLHTKSHLEINGLLFPASGGDD